MATPRETAFVYATDSEEGQQLSGLAEKHHLAVQLRMGGVDAAVEEASSWMIAPHYLIVDLTGAEDPIAQLRQVAENGPAGETDVIAFGDQDYVGLYRELRRMGVVEYLTRPMEPDDVDEVLRELIQRRRDETKAIDPERLIVVTSVRGGAGGSTVAGGLAHIVANNHGRRTLLLDLDLDGGTQYIQYNIESTQGLLDMVEMPHRIDAVFLERTLGVAGQRLSILSADRPQDEREPKEEGVDSLVQQAGQGIDSIVVDLPRLAPVGRHVLFGAGTAVLVTPPTLVGLRDTTYLVDEIERGGTARRIVVVINSVGMYSAGTLKESDFAKRLGRTVATLPFDRRGVPQSMVQGIPVTEGSAPVGRGLRRIAQTLPTAPTVRPSLLDKLTGRTPKPGLGASAGRGRKREKEGQAR